MPYTQTSIIGSLQTRSTFVEAPPDTLYTDVDTPTAWREWHHAPSHCFMPQQSYIVTCGTHNKAHYLNTPNRLSRVQNALFDHAEQFSWKLEAWAILSNHYHFVARSPENAASLESMLRSLHSKTAIELNSLDNTPGRKVWYQYWDTCLTDSKSYFARLHYVHNNPAHHSVVPNAAHYSWCSMNWFVQKSGPGARRKVLSFKIDKVKVPDDF